jgi:T5SS/PEP-CTERM-associated repeat protein
LEIRDGAHVSSGRGVIGFADIAFGAARRNSVLVAGAGSGWSNAGDLEVGGDGTHNDLVISDGGQVSCETGYVGAGGELTGLGSGCQRYEGFNTALVTGPALWQVRGKLFVGSNCYGNRLTISNGGVVTAAGLVIGANSASPPGSLCGPEPDQNKLVIDGGCLAVTNAGFVSAIVVRYGTLILNRGVIETRDFRIHNGPFGRMEFQGGTLRTINALVWGVPLDVGDGVHSAVLQVNGNDSGFEFLNVRPGGVLHMAKALHSTILTNAGTIAPGSADSLRAYVEGTITQLPEGILSFGVGGRAQGSNYAFLICSGTIHLDGSLHVQLRGGFVPAPNDFFEILRTSFLVGACTNAPQGGRLKTVDNLGSFLVSYSPTNIVLSDYQSTDLDGDGLEDAWATNYFGHSPLTPAEKPADSDGDGASNGDEFRAGTDPTNPGSVFKAVIELSGDTASVTFDCVDRKTYRVWFSNDLQSWEEVPDPTFAFPQKGRRQWLDDRKDTAGKPVAPRFYRVSVE